MLALIRATPLLFADAYFFIDAAPLLRVAAVPFAVID